MWEICYSGNCMPSIPFNIVIELFLNLMFSCKISSLLTLCFEIPPILHFHWLDEAAWKAVEPTLFIYPTLWNPPQFVKDVAFPEVVCQKTSSKLSEIGADIQNWPSPPKDYQISTRAQIQEQYESFWIKRPPALWSEKQTRHLQILITRSAAASSASSL